MSLVLVLAGFTGASHFNCTLENVVRSELVGPFRPAVSHTRLRPMVEYGADCFQTFGEQKGSEANCPERPSAASIRFLSSGELRLDCAHKFNQKSDLEYIQDGDGR